MGYIRNLVINIAMIMCALRYVTILINYKGQERCSICISINRRLIHARPGI